MIYFFFICYNMHTVHAFIQSHSYNTFIRHHSPGLLSISSSLVGSVGKNLPLVPSRESNSGLPYSKPTRYQLSHAAPFFGLSHLRYIWGVLMVGWHILEIKDNFSKSLGHPSAPQGVCSFSVVDHGKTKYTFNKEIFLLFSMYFFLPPLRFHWVGGCWDLNQDRCNFGIGSQTL